MPWANWFRPFRVGEVEAALALNPSPFIGDDRALAQLRYVERYADSLGCQSFVVEDKYIDRDYMEDHSVFYSKCIRPYANFCRRIHFFSEVPGVAAEKVRALHQHAQGKVANQAARLCDDLSADLYLGFSVIKPLDGSPVGRTVLACLPGREPAEDGSEKVTLRNYGGCKLYHANFLGVRWAVNGLAFQQQDVGVSACATTAIWSSLHKASVHEAIEPATPVGITQLATRFSLVGGRSMPAGGLEIDQMCEAIRASGLAPSLFRVRGKRDLAKFLIRVGIQSGHAPILLLKNSGAEGHAVTAIGTKSECDSDEAISVASAATPILYIHDDRFGPNIRCELGTMDAPSPQLQKASDEMEQSLQVSIRPPSQTQEESKMESGISTIDISDLDDSGVEGLVRPVETTAKNDVWELTHVLIPIHPKIRLSLVDFKTLEVRIESLIRDFADVFPLSEFEPLKHETLVFDTRLVRTSAYVSTAIRELPESDARNEIIEELVSSLNKPRYVGRVRVHSRHFQPIDCLFDTTSTYRNIQCLGIVAATDRTGLTPLMIDYLTKST